MAYKLALLFALVAVASAQTPCNPVGYGQGTAADNWKYLSAPYAAGCPAINNAASAGQACANVPGPTGWSDEIFDDSAWAVGATPFGANLQCFTGVPNLNNVAINQTSNGYATYFPNGSNLFLRRYFTITADQLALFNGGQAYLHMIVDNALKGAWINGQMVSGAMALRQNCNGVSAPFDVLINVPVHLGSNTIAIEVADYGGQSFFTAALNFMENDMNHQNDAPCASPTCQTVGYYPTTATGTADISSNAYCACLTNA